MKSRVLAEAIILQSLEDLWDSRHRSDSLKFFSGPEFRTCAKMAGMGIEEKLKLLGMVKKATSPAQKSAKAAATAKAGRAHISVGA